MMDPLKLLSIGAIAIAIGACLVTYILYRRTSDRLDSLTQANLGITHTIHRLIASSMQPAPTTDMNGSGEVGTSGRTVGRVGMSTSKADERVVVSDDESSSSGSSMSDDTDDDGSDDDGSVDDGSVDDGDDVIELGEATPNKASSSVHNIVVNSVLFSNSSRRFEEINDNDGPEHSDGDDISSCSSDTDDDDDDDSDDGHLDVVKLGGDDVHITTDEMPGDGDDDDANQGGDQATGNVDLVAFLLPQSNPNNLDIGIIPVSSKQKGLIPHENAVLTRDSMKQMKVEELRKLVVSKFGMTDDEAKKLKKPQLVQKLSESH